MSRLKVRKLTAKNFQMKHEIKELKLKMKWQIKKIN